MLSWQQELLETIQGYTFQYTQAMIKEDNGNSDDS